MRLMNKGSQKPQKYFYYIKEMRFFTGNSETISKNGSLRNQ